MANYDPIKLQKELKALTIISADRLDKACQEAETKKSSFASTLLAQNLISDDSLGEIIAEIISFPFIHLGKISIPQGTLLSVPGIMATKQSIIAFKKDNDGLHLAMNNPTNIHIKELLAKKTGLRIVPYFATKADIKNALGAYR